MNRLFHVLLKSLPGITICLGLGSLSGLVVRARNLAWYATLMKPSFTPPSYLFGPVWTLLYILMGISLTMIWETRSEHPVLTWLFFVQLALNVFWSPVFFYAQRIDLALLVIIALWLALLACLVLSWHSKPLFLLWIPYFLWTSFASILNASLYLLN